MNKSLTEVRLKPGRYSLQRVRDGMGDSGPRWQVYDLAKSELKKAYVWLEDAQGLIKVGCGIRVGSLTARTYEAQDWWQCTAVTEILEVNEDKTCVKFKTRNSTYIAKSF